MHTIGTDVEVFLQNGKGFVSAHDLIPGTKQDPHPVDGGAVQVDGVAAELNTIPCSTFSEFKNGLQTVTHSLMAIVPQHELLSSVTVEVDLDSLPDYTKRLSCESDLDPYEEDINKPLCQEVPYRSAGGHIHIGGFIDESVTGYERFSSALRMARLMDKYVGVYSLLWDKDAYRRSTYGKAGACRVKPYGMEYRTLSNAWFFNERVMKFVFEATNRAVEAFHRGEDGEDTYRNIINSKDHTDKFFNSDPIAQEVKAIC